MAAAAFFQCSAGRHVRRTTDAPALVAVLYSRGRAIVTRGYYLPVFHKHRSYHAAGTIGAPCHSHGNTHEIFVPTGPFHEHFCAALGRGFAADCACKEGIFAVADAFYVGHKPSFGGAKT